MKTRDPYTVILAARLGISENRARRAVAVFVESAHLWKRWSDASELAMLLKWKGDHDALGEAMVAARLVEPEGAAGFVLCELDATTLAAVAEEVREEREAARDRKADERIRRELAGNRVTSCDIDGNRVTSRYKSADDAAFSTFSGHEAPAEGVASQITRVAPARGNLPPPTPSTPLARFAAANPHPNAATSSSAPPASASAPGPADIPSLMSWLHALLRRRGFTGPNRLDSSQQGELLDAIQAGIEPETIARILHQAADNGARKMSWLRVAIERELSDLSYRACAGEDESRGPPMGEEPVSIEAKRLLREFHQRGGDE